MFTRCQDLPESHTVAQLLHDDRRGATLCRLRVMSRRSRLTIPESSDGRRGVGGEESGSGGAVGTAPQVWARAGETKEAW